MVKKTMWLSYGHLDLCPKKKSLSSQGNDIIREAAKWSPELAVACEVWKEIKFEFDTIDTV
jgi:hypothetical protein